jgi:putative nucleotidyltransferase with HDIG domain
VAVPTRSGAQPVRPHGALSVYIRAIVAIGVLVLAHSAGTAVRTPPPLGWLVFTALAIVTGSFKVNFASISASLFVSDTFFITIAVLYGAAPATLTIALDSLIICIRRKEPWQRLAFNVAAPALSFWAGAQACFAAAGVPPVAGTSTPVASLALPLLLLASVYFLLNSVLTATAISLESRQSPFPIWRRHFMWLSVAYLAAASAAFCLILLTEQVSLSAALMVLPLLAVFHLTIRASVGRLEDAQRHLKDLDRLYLSTVETLAMAIDAKDDVTHSHVRRVQAYAVGLARALGIDDELDIKAIEAAALLHDTGKLAVPEHILNKPGKLTESEFEKMKLHVDVGADILSLVEFPYPVVPIVRCHHENWDGSGYPRGTSGDDIPIGARILSVVDCYDALTSDRPYRRAMSEEAALGILRERRGTMYDPRVVDTFIAVYRSIEVGEADTPEHREVLRRIATSRATPPDATEAPADAPAPVSSQVLAFVSLSRMAAGGGTVQDVLALSSNLLADVFPDVTGAWYLPDGGRTRLEVAQPFGPAAHVLRGASVMVGERLTGWVAATRQMVINSDAALDLEAAVDQASPPLKSCLSVPLLAGDAIAGVLTLYSPSGEGFDQNRGRVIQMIAPHLAAALQAAGRASAAPVKEHSHDRPASAGRDLRLVSHR